MAFHLSLRPQTLTKLRRICPLSSSSSAVPDPSSAAAAAAPPTPPSCASPSPSSDIKDRIFKKNHLDKPSFDTSNDPKRTDHSFDFTRENLRKFTGVQPPKPSSRGLDDLTSRSTLPIKTDQLPSSIFGKEKPTDDADPKTPNTEKELREKLRRLRPEVKLRELEEKVADRIAELNDRLVKPRGKEKPTDLADSKALKWQKELREEFRRLRPEKPTDLADSKARKWREEFRRLRPEVKLRQLEEKVADSIAELNYRLMRLRELEEKVADLIPSSIFGKEKPTADGDLKASKWENILREKFPQLCPELRELDENVAYSIAELNDRLVKLRELEEKVADSIPSSILGKKKPNDDAYPNSKWEKELREKLRQLRPEMKLRQPEEKVADSIVELNDRLEVKLLQLEEKVVDSIAELNGRLVKLRELEKAADLIAKPNNRLVKLGKMEEKVADSRMGGESLVGTPGNPLQSQGG